MNTKDSVLTHALCAACLGLAVLALPAHGRDRDKPDWSELDRFQETISADTFSRLVNEYYVPDGSMVRYLRYDQESVWIYQEPTQSNRPLYRLFFAPVDPAPLVKRVGGDFPLQGLRVALDPGHLGGPWARMEERFFYVDRETDWPVQEGAMNLFVARLIRAQLEELGAEVFMVRDDFEPASDVRPDELLADAEELPDPDRRFSHMPDLLIEASQRDRLRKDLEKEFYRHEEIKARAQMLNEQIKPDVTLCIHFNATGYGDERILYEENGLTFFVGGNYMSGEVRKEDQKFRMLRKLLELSRDEEIALTRKICEAFVDATGLPPSYENYGGTNMRPVGSDYIYARNLAANSRYHGPVIFLEPYFMNNRTVYARIQAGDFDGEKEIDGGTYRSIFREYADAVVDGLMRHYAPEFAASGSAEE